MSTTAAASPCVRQRSRPKPRQKNEAEDVDIRRLRAVLDLLAAGHSQVEIGRRFRRTPRTIHRWIARAKELQLHALKQANPQSMVAQSLYRLARLEARLFTTLERAERRRDHQIVLDCHRELRALERDRYAMLDRARFFDSAKWHHDAPDRDPRMKEADEVRQMIRAFFSEDYWTKDGTLDEQKFNQQDRARDEGETIF